MTLREYLTPLVPADQLDEVVNTIMYELEDVTYVEPSPDCEDE
jgi:hypothetical protein